MGIIFRDRVGCHKITVFLWHIQMSNDFINLSKRWERGRSSVSAAICRQQVTVDKSTDTRWPHHAYGQCWTPTTAIALWNGIGDAAVTIRLNDCRPCSGTHCRIRTFTTAPSLTAWTASTEKDSVAMTGLSDPRHCGTLLFFGVAPISSFQCFSPSPPPSCRRRFMFSWAFIRGSLFNKAYHQQVGQYELLAIT